VDPLDTVVAGLSCREVLHHLNDFLDGDLPVPDVARVTAHLAGCRTCEQFGGRVGALVASLRSDAAPAASVPAGPAARLRQRLLAEQR